MIEVLSKVDNIFVVRVQLNEEEQEQYDELCMLLLSNSSTEEIEEVLYDNGWFWSNDVLYTSDWNSLIDVLDTIRELVKG